MTALELLLTRQSCANVVEPAPTQTDLDIILQAGMRVPDHGNLSPWQFTVITGDGLLQLTNIFSQAAIAAGMSEAKIAKAQTMAYRAPMIIVISSNLQQHDKVPVQEQLIAGGCVVHAMQMAAFALGYGAMWRTGEFSYDVNVKQALKVTEANQILGFLYIGTPVKTPLVKPTKPFTGLVRLMK